MQLVADRFIVDVNGLGIDLATGNRVWIIVSAAGGPGEQAEWAERCCWLSSVVHPSIAPLVDYGAVGESKRFEAFEAATPWRGSAGAARTVVARAKRFLDVSRRSWHEDDPLVVADRSGRVRVVLRRAATLVSGAAEPSGPLPRDLLGIVRPPERRLHAIGEALGEPTSGRVTALGLYGPDARAIDRAIAVIARDARLAGYVPISIHQCSADLRRALHDRTCFLIARDIHDGWRSIVNLALENARPHVVLFAVDRAVRRVHTVNLQRLPAEMLVAAVCPSGAARVHAKHVSAAVRRSGGWLHRFEELLLGETGGVCRTKHGAGSMSYPRTIDVALKAAEHVLAYGVDDRSIAAPPGAPDPKPAAGELMRLRRQWTSAQEWVANGRHQPAERALRQVMHAFARRREWPDAAASGVCLVSSLLARGRVAAADDVMQSICPWIDTARDIELSLRAGVLRGSILLEQGRPADAESVLETVLASAASVDSEYSIDAALALVRCLYWQGRYSEAWRRLSLFESDAHVQPRDRVRILTARCRVAVGLQRLADAVASGAQARERAMTIEEPSLTSAALYAGALAQFAAGDRRQADALAVEAADAARRAHDPMRTLVVRVLRAEIARRQGQRGPAAVLTRRTARLSSSALPATVRARVELLRDSLSGADVAAAAEARGRSTGLFALRVFAPSPEQPACAGSISADEISDIMRCCQAADDERAVLAALCGRLRGRLHAAAVAFFLVEGEQAVQVAAEGARVDPSTPARVLTANQFVPPHAGERVESGVPVRYAGRLVGLLVATWTPGTAWHGGDAALLLSVGATAAGPALSGVIARRSADPAGRTADLTGVSRAMADVRLAVERAASAPFAVLVEGESGSGKELVARLLHTLGPRRDRPFCTLNCAALPEDLVESELFGHARGAFTGAAGERRGVFEDAHTGTLFLDEIGELSPRAQAKLLRAIQEGEIRRVGENVCRRVDVRLVTATNRDLRAEVSAGRFRADLLYRLDVIRIVLPPLRERRDDIAVLAERYWRESTSRVGSRAVLAASTISALTRYDWPGNIRELQNVLAALAVRCGKRGVVPPTALPPQFGGETVSGAFRLEEARRQFERSFVRAALVRTGGRRSRAAEQLGVSRQGLAKLMARLGIDEDGPHADAATARS